MPALIGDDTDIYGALQAFQAEGIELQKNAINPHFKNKYISLDSLMGKILPILNGLGIVLIQAPDNIDGEPALTTLLQHVASNTGFQITMPLVLGKDDPQGQGAAITYARRYALMSILGLVADEDTDAQGVKARSTRSTRTVVKAKPEEGLVAADFGDSGKF
jgi:hypothetical protein